MWWKKNKQAEPDLVSQREQLNRMATILLSQSEVDFDRATQLEQALIGTFIFGMIHAHGISQGLTPPQVHALALTVFKDSLHYTDEAAVQGVQECINATKPGYHATMNAILHRGIDGYQQYKKDNLAGLHENITTVLKQFKNPGS